MWCVKRWDWGHTVKNSIHSMTISPSSPMAVVLESCSVNVSFHSLKCPDLYDKVYDYFTLITQTKVLQSFLEKKKRKLPETSDIGK